MLLIILSCLVSTLTKASEPTAERPTILLVEPDTSTDVQIKWTDTFGVTGAHAVTLAYAADADRQPLTTNLDCFVAVGGTRLAKGAGHPKGAIVRVGFYKRDKARPMFGNITKDTVFEVTLSKIRFNQPVDVHASSILQHLKYDKGDMDACGIPGDAREQFNTASPVDTLNDRVRPGVDARLGSLPDTNITSDDPEAHKKIFGSSALKVEDDGSVTMTVRFRYPALRNLRDPWQSDLPGTFLEPIHFHIEFEALPKGVKPLDPTRVRVTPLAPAD